MSQNPLLQNYQSSSAKALIEHFNIGVEAFGERPIALFTICGDHQFQVRILAQ